MNQNQVSARPASERPVDVLKGILNAPSVQEQFSNALSDSKDLFVASIIDLYNGDKGLQECEPKAIVSEALKAAVMKTPINKALGFAYIVVYKNNVRQPDGTWKKIPTPTFILGYKGYIQLAQRTGFYENINADVVYEGQLVSQDLLSGEIVLDASKKKSDKVIGYFAHFRLLNGFRKTFYMSVEEMAFYAKKYSPSIGKEVTKEDLIAQANVQQTSKAVGWGGNFTDMALKTCIRKLLSKYGYLSIEMQNALSGEANAEYNSDRDAILIDSRTEVKEIDVEAVEVVDTETGEVTSAPKQTPTESKQTEPDF